ncbi:MAG: aromatic ring-hydroxylating dioxygenase subunit alpha, partial [Acidobacteriia bacterium]|nr:aromatic ring-hydroxylating dioxygenase subunit alpha [Terriglobia bacterium]
PITDPATGRWISSHIMNQDFVAWVGQGTVADRTQEHLGTSDRGILAIRKRYLADLETISRGQDPKAVIRNPEVNHAVPLPVADRRYLIDGVTREELLRHPVLAKHLTHGYPFQAGQPEEVREAYEAAMGISLPRLRVR